MNPPCILLTGFQPFGGEAVNPSWQVAQALHGKRIGSATVHALELPCAFATAGAVLAQALHAQRPALVLALGLAAGRAEFSIERVAINLSDARIADNLGAQPLDEAVVPGAPAAYFATLPIKAMAAALRSAGLPAAISHSAGTYVCNHLFYALMHLLHGQPGTRGGFMHLPLLPAQAAQRGGGVASLPLATQVEGVHVALAAALAQHADLRETGGSEA